MSLASKIRRGLATDGDWHTFAEVVELSGLTPAQVRGAIASTAGIERQPVLYRLDPATAPDDAPAGTPDPGTEASLAFVRSL